jgi:hypothetical protein
VKPNAPVLRCPRQHGACGALSLADLQRGKAVKPIDTLVIRDDALAPQENSKPPVSEPPALHRKLMESLDDRGIVAPVMRRYSPKGPSIASCDDTGLAFA